ncbi:MAG: molybdopterin-guanine dinucleotide biosynthesis protein B [Halanaerobiales bacterium]
MKVLNVMGYTKTGKTTTIEKIIEELRNRNYTVGSIKDIHFEEFAIDTPGTNTDRHRQAGSQLVTARGLYETDILFPRQLDLYEIVKFYDHDFLVIEGYSDSNTPKILTASDVDDIESKIDETVFLISGKIADNIDSYKGIPAISALDDVNLIVDIIVEKSFELLPDFDKDCCGKCGYSCRELCVKIIQNEKERSDCVLDNQKVRLTVNGNEIKMVPFVQSLLKNAVIGVAKELKGYESNSEIIVRIDENN